MGEQTEAYVNDLASALGRTYEGNVSSVFEGLVLIKNTCVSIYEDLFHSGLAFPIVRDRILHDLQTIKSMDREIATKLVDADERARATFKALSLTHYIASGGQKIEDNPFEKLEEGATLERRIDAIMSMVDRLIEICASKESSKDCEIVDELSSLCLDDAYGDVFTSLRTSDMPDVPTCDTECASESEKSNSEGEGSNSESDSEGDSEGDSKGDSEGEESNSESDSGSEEGGSESDSESDSESEQNEGNDNEYVKDLEFALGRTYRQPRGFSPMDCTLMILDACTSIRDESCSSSGHAFPIVRDRIVRDLLSITKVKRRIMKKTLGDADRARSIHEILSLVHKVVCDKRQKIEKIEPSTDIEKIVEDVMVVLALIVDKFYNVKDIKIRRMKSHDMRRFQIAANNILTTLSSNDAHDWNFTTLTELRSTAEQIMYSLIRADDQPLVSIVPTKTRTMKQLDRDFKKRFMEQCLKLARKYEQDSKQLLAI